MNDSDIIPFGLRELEAFAYIDELRKYSVMFDVFMSELDIVMMKELRFEPDELCRYFCFKNKWRVDDDE